MALLRLDFVRQCRSCGLLGCARHAQAWPQVAYVRHDLGLLGLRSGAGEQSPQGAAPDPVPIADDVIEEIKHATLDMPLLKGACGRGHVEGQISPQHCSTGQ